MVNEKIIAAIKSAREGSPKRNFRQSFDLAINFRDLDTKKQENKIKAEIVLPNPPAAGRIGFFADSLVAPAKKLGERIVLITKDQIDAYGKNKKAAKALANSVDSFLAEAGLMPAVAKALGPVLAVRGKMPKPVPPTIPDLSPLVTRTSATVKVAIKDSPVVHTRVGTEDMDDEKVAANIEAITTAVIAALPKGKEQVRNGVVKLTMGKAVKFEVA
jgi:large subunit ribosomal protein L1